MMFYLATVFIGTIYPIFTQVFFNTKISVGPPFYNAVIAPVIISFLILMAIGPKISWIKHKYKKQLIARVLNVKTSNAPKNKTIPNNRNFVIALGITILLKEYVGIVLINSSETKIKNTGTTKS